MVLEKQQKSEDTDKSPHYHGAYIILKRGELQTNEEMSVVTIVCRN